jgi:uncharacterized YigZ family protein
MDVTARAAPRRVAERFEHEMEKVQGSRFLTTLLPAETFDVVLREQVALKQAHPHARHVCFAFVAEDERNTRYSDDGEPGKTAGLPMLRVLLGGCLRSTAALVTRYFGGVKLGTGGLVRAYTRATQEALDAAPLLAFERQTRCTIQCAYAAEPKLRHELGALGATITHASYGETVALSVTLPEPLVGELEQRVGQNSPCAAIVQRQGATR